MITTAMNDGVLYKCNCGCEATVERSGGVLFFKSPFAGIHETILNMNDGFVNGKWSVLILGAETIKAALNGAV
jgi:hypothetical protein